MPDEATGSVAPAQTTEPGDAAASDVAETTLLTAETTGSADESTASGASTGDEPGETAEAGTGESDTASTAPEAYADFEMPEGQTLNAEVLATAAPMFKDLGLSQDQAQKVVSFYADQVQAGEQAQSDAFNQLKSDWQEQSRNDKEFGGDKFNESVGIAQSAIAKFGTPELKTLLNEHGVGNHPEVIRFMVKVGKLTQEDVPGGGDQLVADKKDRVSILYPKSESA